jgi:hypothetical protein
MNAIFGTGVVDGTQMDGCYENRDSAASGARFEHILINLPFLIHALSRTIVVESLPVTT